MFRKRSRWTLIAASKTPRSNSGEGVRRSPWCTALAKVNVCRAVSQSPNSLEVGKRAMRRAAAYATVAASPSSVARSEEHTSELQSRQYLVCRLLLEKKKVNFQ